MGIVFHVASKKNPAMYSIDDPNQYLKWAWRDIRWNEIFECIGIDMSPTIYYDSYDYNNRTFEEVRCMRNLIEIFTDKTFDISDESAEYQRLRDELHDDAVKLLEFFDYYVENEAYITIT